MQKAIEDESVKCKVITPDDGGHYFFGYYDLQPFDSTGRYHLCHKAGFEDHIPEPNDVCELGMIDLNDNSFIKLAETKAWNFQQGAMLRWYKDDNHILFNVYEDGAYKCCILNIKTSERRILPRAIGDVSKNGKYGLCLNFSRVFDFRPGYGYSAIKDPYFNLKSPDDDGVFLMDMETGECKLLFSYNDVKVRFPKEPFSNGKLLVNHINFNPSGNRYAMLFRNFRENGIMWKTQLLTGDLDGNLFLLADYAFHSHYNWKNDNQLLIFSGLCEEKREDGLYLFNDCEKKVIKLPFDTINKDIHCLYSSNRRYISGDGYPDGNGYRTLYLLDTKDNSINIIGKYYSGNPKGLAVEYRCDLHARYNQSGRYLSFDSVHVGHRCICIADLKQLKGYQY